MSIGKCITKLLDFNEATGKQVSCKSLNSQEIFAIVALYRGEVGDAIVAL